VAPDKVALNSLYIEYVAVAPWSRPDVRNAGLCLDPPRFFALGTIMFTKAISKSIELGLSGLLAWHSVPRAEERYNAMFLRRCGEPPRSCGIDVQSECQLLEITKEMAAKW